MLRKIYKFFIFFASLFLFSFKSFGLGPDFSQTQAENLAVNPDPALQTTPINFRVDYLQLRIPNQTDSLGLLGLHAQIIPFKHSLPYFYTGLGTYGAVRGDNSGFFALGLESGVQYPIDKNWLIDSGLFLGTGGGHGLSSTVGDGAFLESHFGIDYRFYSDFDYFLLGLAFSHLRFFNSEINDNQLLFNITIPTDFSYFPGFMSSQDFTHDFNPALYQFSRNYFDFTSHLYFPTKNSQTLSGQKLNNSMGLVGFEFGHYFKNNSPYFIFLNTNGAISGNKDGYAEALGGLGASYQSNQTSFYFLSKLSAGSAGGGDIDTAGGFVIKPELGLEFKPANNLGLALTGAYLFAPGSSYKVWTAGLDLKYYFDLGSLSQSLSPSLSQSNNLSPDLFNNTGSFNHFRFRLGNQTYLHPERENSSSEADSDTDSDTNPDINLLGIKIDFFCQKYLYLTGQTAFAYTGNAAGYFSGLVGLGLQSPAYHHVYLYSELLGGAAGGAGLDIGSGKMLEPLLGLGVQINPAWGIYGSWGKTFSPNNQLKTSTIDLGFSYALSTLSHS